MQHFLATATALAALLQTAAATQHLNITALTTAAPDRKTVLQCWCIDPPFNTTTKDEFSITDQSLGNASSVGMTVSPAGYDQGVHFAGAVQFVFWLSGLTHITLPHEPDHPGVFVAAGQMIFVTDTPACSDTGHGATYPGTTETVQVKVRTADGVVPEHTVLHDGPCTASELGGLNALA